MRILLISTFLLLLTGCGENKTCPDTPTLNTHKVFKIIIDRTGNMGAVSHPEGTVISSKELFLVAIADLTENADAINHNAPADKNQIHSWIKALNDENVDFTKDNILIYTFEQHSICEYSEDRFLRDTKEVDIIFIQTSEVCMSALTTYYLAYKVSKDIKIVNIKAFEKEFVAIDMQ